MMTVSIQELEHHNLLAFLRQPWKAELEWLEHLSLPRVAKQKVFLKKIFYFQSLARGIHNIF